MGQVLALRSTPVNPEVVEAAREILRRAEAGMQAFMFVGIDVAGQAEIGICGDFADDLDYATEAAREGFSRLVGHKFEEREAEEALPHRLQPKVRKA